MAALAGLERLLERIFERTAARVFRTRVQVVQLERRLERSMDQARRTTAGRTSIPSRYRVRMNASDLADAAARTGGAEQLAGRLADAGLAFARAHRYHLQGRPTVVLVADPSLAGGQVAIDAVVDPPAGSIAEASREPAGPAEPVTPGVREHGTPTRIYRRPVPVAARAILRVLPPGGREHTIEVDGTPLTIGRGGDNGLVLADTRVSRYHGRLQARHGGLVYTDLGSTNGSFVNGVRVDELALGHGDRLEIGGTVLLVETLPS